MRWEIIVVIVGLERIRIDLSYALRDLAEELRLKENFDICAYEKKFIKYLMGETDAEIEGFVKNHAYVFIAYSNLDKLIRNRRFNK